MAKLKAIGNELRHILNYSQNIAIGLMHQWKKKFDLMNYKTLEQVVEETTKDYKKVNLIGHSFGGLKALSYTLENPEKIQKCTTIGTPFDGTSSAYLSVLFLPLGVIPKSAQQLKPGNEFVRALREYFTEHAGQLKLVSFENILSADDELVPQESAEIKRFVQDATNVREYVLSGVGHGSLINHGKVHSSILNAIQDKSAATIFIHGFAMEKVFFKNSLKEIRKANPEEFEDSRIFRFSYDYTEPIIAEKIMNWYEQNGSNKGLEKNLLYY